jgi:hypothetical protein
MIALDARFFRGIRDWISPGRVPQPYGRFRMPCNLYPNELGQVP